MRRVFPIIALLLLFAYPALAGQTPFADGLDGRYWGLSRDEVMERAPGKFLAEKTNAGMLMLEYDTPSGGFPTKTAYIFRDGKCWKMTVDVVTQSKKDTPAMRKLYKAVLEAITAELGGTHQSQSWEDLLYRMYWRGQHTEARLEFAAVGAASGESGMSLHLESSAMAKDMRR